MSSNLGRRVQKALEINGNSPSFLRAKKPGKADLLGVSAEEINSAYHTWR